MIKFGVLKNKKGSVAIQQISNVLLLIVLIFSILLLFKLLINLTDDSNLENEIKTEFESFTNKVSFTGTISESDEIEFRNKMENIASENKLSDGIDVEIKKNIKDGKVEISVEHGFQSSNEKVNHYQIVSDIEVEQ